MSSKKANPILKGGARMQPIRATQPFQLLQGTQVRKSPSSSPTPRSAAEARVNVRNRWSPDHRSSPDRVDRKSPISSIKVSNRRSPSPSIRRTSSLDTIAGPYLTGQWPRDAIANHQNVNQFMHDKATQIPDWNADTPSQSFLIKSSTKAAHSRSPAIAEPDVKQMREQMRRNAKSSRHNDKKDRTPPVHGNHLAVQQLPAPQTRSMSNSISIGGQTFGRTPRRQNSVEALNKEIDMFINNDNTYIEPKIVPRMTPPDGHRAPLPRSSTRSMETQTPQAYARESSGNIAIVPIPSPSPTSEQQQAIPSHTLRNTAEGDGKDICFNSCLKYASSPLPNNSYMFKREPPEGAENVKPFKEQDAQQQISPTCPDKNKVNFYPKINASAFAPPLQLKSKLRQLHLSNVLGTEQNSNALHGSMIGSLVQVNANNNNNNTAMLQMGNISNSFSGLSMTTSTSEA